AAKFGLAQIAQYTFDTTLGVGSLLMSGVLDRFARLKLVLSHGGGAYPYLAGRFDIMHRRMDRAAQGDVAAKAPSAYASQMLYDSIVHAPKALRFLVELAGLDNVVLGTDYSFPPADMEPLALLRSAGLAAGEVEAVADGDPRRGFAGLRWSVTTHGTSEGSWGTWNQREQHARWRYISGRRSDGRRCQERWRLDRPFDSAPRGSDAGGRPRPVHGRHAGGALGSFRQKLGRLGSDQADR